jgi:hypothetical protein
MASLFAALRENHPPSTVHLSGADDAFPASHPFLVLSASCSSSDLLLL